MYSLNKNIFHESCKAEDRPGWDNNSYLHLLHYDTLSTNSHAELLRLEWRERLIVTKSLILELGILLKSK